MIRATNVIALALLPAALFAATPSGSNRIELLRELDQCIKSLTQGTQKVVSPCARRDVRSVIGVPKMELLSILGNPDFCLVSNNQLLLWKDEGCSVALKIGYSFYRLPEDTLGGGPELVFTVDSAQTVVAATWVGTQ